MYRKKSFKRLNAMWENSNSHIKITDGTESAYLKKSMDDICFQAELAESSWEYANVICKGMRRLFKMGLAYQKIITHHNLLQKLLYLGRDLMQTNSQGQDLFYLGVLIELKIYSKWKSIEFYTFILSALKAIKNNFKFIGKRVKDKLLLKLKKYNEALYYEMIEELSTA